ncbi:MAG: heavy metal translocating P-type ATPase metal-binding domain-containing protein [Anaerolineales bacterium]|nr:heavy metal translocating P-type ATPase metal-binding domain-containing protein [Anaerolineales bacterium]
MVKDAVRCEHCGAETKHPVTKKIGGRELNFCCAGCLAVYEFLIEENLLAQVKQEEQKRDQVS